MDFNDQQLELCLPDPAVRETSPAARPEKKKPQTYREPSEMTATELLANVLGATLEPICAELAETYGDFRSLAGAHPADLRDRGLTQAAINKFFAVFEIARRYGEQEFVPGQVYRCSADLYEHFRERLGTETVELFVAVLLDNKHRKLRDVVVSKGSLTASIVHPRDVFAQVVRYAAAAVIFVHNHPSGDPTPSREDLDITRRLRQVGDLMGVRVLDHIVIGAGRYVSFVDDGYW